MQIPSSRFVALLLFCATVAVACEPDPPEMIGPEEGVTATEMDPLSAKPECPGHPSCKEDDDDGDSSGPSATSGINAPPFVDGVPNALATDGDQAADRKENKRTLEYRIPGGNEPFMVWITASDATVDGTCATSGDFAAAGVTEAELASILQQDLGGSATAVGDGGLVVDKRTTGPSDLNRVVLVWDPDPAVDGDFVARVPAEANLLDGVAPPSVILREKGGGIRQIEMSGGVVRLTNRGAAPDWPTIECVNNDVLIVNAFDPE